jgi:paraquat-inducible protein B
MRNLILTLIIWIICFTAITIGVTMTYNWIRKLGIDMHISFEDVNGLVPNESKVVYKGVHVGNISDIYIDPNTSNPKIKIRITKRMAKLIGKDSKFWIVRPELGIGAVNNLSTIVTGSYVAVEPIAGEFANEFKGLDEEPPDVDFICGLNVTLQTSSADGLNNNSPILYRGLQIGEVDGMGLSKDKRKIVINACINDEYVEVIRKNTNFGNISGFHADIHLFGTSEIGMNSLKTLVKGGIAVVTPNFNAPVAQNGDMFILLTNDEMQARQNH